MKNNGLIKFGSLESGPGLALLAVGAAGAWVCERIGVPAGVVVGALLASGLYRLAGGDPGPWRIRFGRAGRLLFGTVIGSTFASDALEPLRTAVLPMFGVIAVTIAVGLALGWALGRLTPLDSVTALLASVPGGLPAMAAVADETDADATVVMAIHFSRLTAVLAVAPVVIRLLANPSARDVPAIPAAGPAGFWGAALTLGVGLVAGLAAVRLAIPSGDFIGPIFVLAGWNLLGAGAGALDGGFRTATMVLVGVSVGSQMSRESVRLLRRVVLPAGGLIFVMISVGLILGWALSQVTSLDLTSALLSSVPGGATTMPAVAHDLGGDMRVVAALHLMRQMVVFVLLPAVLSHLLRRRRSAARVRRLSDAHGISITREGST